MAQHRFMIKNLLGLDENDNCPPFNPPVQPVHLPVHPAPQRVPFQALNWSYPFPAPFFPGFAPAMPLAMPFTPRNPMPVRHNSMPQRRPVLDAPLPRPPYDGEMNLDFFIAKCCHLGMPEDLTWGLASKFGVAPDMVKRKTAAYRKEHNITGCLMRKAAKLQMRRLLLEKPMLPLRKIAKKCHKTEEVVIAFWITEWFLEGEH